MLKSHSLTQEHKLPEATVAETVAVFLSSIEHFSEAELIELRHQVDVRLVIGLEHLDLSEELALQFRQGKALLHEVQNDKTIATNQKAQVFNTVKSQLAEIVKQQESVWSMERLKIFEVAFVKASKLLTQEARDAFFDLYGRFLKDEHAADAG